MTLPKQWWFLCSRSEKNRSTGVFIYWGHVSPGVSYGTLSFSVMASERAKKLGKRIVVYQEDQPSVLASKDWIQNLIIVKDPKGFVS
jgi:hypothetical protein